MAQHRRVESRGIVGTGMAADPERIRDIEDEHERRARAWKNAPSIAGAPGFGDVLGKAPPKGELVDEDPEDPRKRKRKAQDESADDAKSDERGAATPAAAAPAPVFVDDKPSAPAPAANAKPSTADAKKALPRVAPDPRERALRARLAQSLAQPTSPPSGDTPPTGSHKRAP